jgi:hypothetical protein
MTWFGGSSSYPDILIGGDNANLLRKLSVEGGVFNINFGIRGINVGGGSSDAYSGQAELTVSSIGNPLFSNYGVETPYLRICHAEPQPLVAKLSLMEGDFA